MTSDQVDTANYLEIALEDDQAIVTPTTSLHASGSSTPAAQPGDDLKAAKRVAREKRIAAAVERSKREYQECHAYNRKRCALLVRSYP